MDDESILLEDVDNILSEVGREKLTDKFKRVLMIYFNN